MKVKQIACQLVAAALIVGLPAGAVAQPESYRDRDRVFGNKTEYCRDYARRAIRAEETNQELNCGFTGPRWHQRQSSHYHWCLNVPRERVEDEIEARRDQLRRCRIGETGGGEGGFCQAYARGAVDAQRVNKRLDCGFYGRYWTSDFETHYDWCVNAPRNRVERASERRQAQLSRCRRYR